jgi:hypothetical protein
MTMTIERPGDDTTRGASRELQTTDEGRMSAPVIRYRREPRPACLPTRQGLDGNTHADLRSILGGLGQSYRAK